MSLVLTFWWKTPWGREVNEKSQRIFIASERIYSSVIYFSFSTSFLVPIIQMKQFSGLTWRWETLLRNFENLRNLFSAFKCWFRVIYVSDKFQGWPLSSLSSLPLIMFSFGMRWKVQRIWWSSSTCVASEKRERKRDAMLYRNLLLIPVLILQYIYFFVGSDINELGFPSSSSHQLHLQGRQIQKQSLWLTFHVIHDLVDVVVLVKVRDDDRCVWYQFLWNVGWMLWRRKHQTPFSSLPGMQSLIVTDDIQGMMIIMTGVRDVLVHCIWWSRLLVVLNNMFMMYIYSFSWVKGTKPA